MRKVPDKFREYTMTDRYEKRWIVVGPSGAMDFHCSHPWIARGYGFDRSGGLEIHYRTPPDYMKADEPSHDHCWMLGVKCWHDGSSLYASEVLIPILEQSGEDAIWTQLYLEYRQRFGPEEVPFEPENFSGDEARA